MAGILSSLLALRFGAPLLLVFLLIGMLAAIPAPASCSSTMSAPPIWWIGGAGADPVRRRTENTLPEHPHRAGRRPLMLATIGVL